MELVADRFRTKLKIVRSVSRIGRLCQIDTSLWGWMLYLYHNTVATQEYGICLVIETVNNVDFREVHVVWLFHDQLQRTVLEEVTEELYREGNNLLSESHGLLSHIPFCNESRIKNIASSMSLALWRHCHSSEYTVICISDAWNRKSFGFRDR